MATEYHVKTGAFIHSKHTTQREAEQEVIAARNQGEARITELMDEIEEIKEYNKSLYVQIADT